MEKRGQCQGRHLKYQERQQLKRTFMVRAEPGKRSIHEEV